MTTRRTIASLTLATGLLAGGVLGLASPASADPLDTGTDTTFEVLAGDLTISVPQSAYLGSGVSGAGLSAQLEAVSVLDQRGLPDASWTAVAYSSDFVNAGILGRGVLPASEVVDAASVSYASGPATSTSGFGTFTPGQAGVSGPTPMVDDGVIAFSHSGGTGGNSASWNPTIGLSIGIDNVSGVYSGSVIHSVA